MNQEQNCGTILVIEDNLSLLEVVKDTLEMEGFSVVTAKNGLEALKALETIESPCLILLDMFMPIMDGWEFLDQLKVKEGNLIISLPVVICSAAGDSVSDVSKLVRGYLKKPVSIGVLLDTVGRYCKPHVNTSTHSD